LRHEESERGFIVAVKTWQLIGVPRRLFHQREKLVKFVGGQPFKPDIVCQESLFIRFHCFPHFVARYSLSSATAIELAGWSNASTTMLWNSAAK
jgi:hypothetical protein